jgi:hypothetical protein
LDVTWLPLASQDNSLLPELSQRAGSLGLQVTQPPFKHTVLPDAVQLLICQTPFTSHCRRPSVVPPVHSWRFGGQAAQFPARHTGVVLPQLRLIHCPFSHATRELESGLPPLHFGASLDVQATQSPFWQKGLSLGHFVAAVVCTPFAGHSR